MSDYSENLRLLCDQYPSISEICRRMQINRQQFNKYLSGQILPARHNQHRICAFFGLDEAELQLPHARFLERMMARHAEENVAPGTTDYVNRLHAILPNDSEKLRRYTGYYFSYFYSLGFPGSIIKCLIHFYEHEGGFFSKSIERLKHKGNAAQDSFIFKYAGVLLYLSDRIFLIEYETLLKDAICHTILYPSYRSRIVFLSGVTLGISSRSLHEPGCTRVEYQYLGKEIDIRGALKSCGLFAPGSSDIDPEIQERIRNSIDPGEFVFKAIEY